MIYWAAAASGAVLDTWRIEWVLLRFLGHAIGRCKASAISTTGVILQEKDLLCRKNKRPSTTCVPYWIMRRPVEMDWGKLLRGLAMHRRARATGSRCQGRARFAPTFRAVDAEVGSRTSED